MCFSLNLPDDQLADMAVAGMLPAVREKLFGMEFDNLGELSQKLSLMSNQAYGFKKPGSANSTTWRISTTSSWKKRTKWRILMMTRTWLRPKSCGEKNR
jgi:hypothetical protein